MSHGFDTRGGSLAIIGVGCRFPGDVNDADDMWELLREGRDATSEITSERWSQSAFYFPEPCPGTTQIKRMGAIKGVDQFDPYFFGISPREAAVMDPQQRLLLETAVEALEDAGQKIDALAGSRTGVFAGVSFSDYGSFQSPEYFDCHSTAGVAPSVISNRISYFLDLKGPSMSIDTACSSSLVAVHTACRSLWNRESDMVLAAGASVLLDPSGFVAFSNVSMINPDGRCYAFDARAQGFVRSEGVGVVVIKRLDDALRDGDPVHAVIVNSGINQDGRSQTLTIPNAHAQEQLLRDVYGEAGIPPERVLFIEAHGTGTRVGDPAEANGIGRALVREGEDDLLLCSVKTNLGHLECGSGVAGLIKAALSLKHRVVPANLNFEIPNPDIPFDELGLRVPTENVPFPESTEPWIAGVNSFGYGGTNAHVVLTEPPVEEAVPAPEMPERFLLPMSARSPWSLEATLESYRDYLGSTDSSLYDVCYTAALRRTHHRHRATVSGRTAEELVQALEAQIENPTLAAIRGDERRLAFVYTGQGPQWWGMGRQLLASEPVFRAVIERCDAVVRALGDWSLLEQFQVGEEASQMEVTAVAQPAIFALQAGLTDLWRSRGVEPDAVVGHSVGEVAAAYAAGVLSLEDACRVIFQRGRCMELASPFGRMLAVGLSAEAVESYIEPFDASISLAAINSPGSVTLSGQPEALESLANDLKKQDVFCKFLRVNYAFHSAQMDPVEPQLKAALADLEPVPAKIPLYSTVSGEETTGSDWDADYWWRNVRETVRFGPAIERMIDSEHRIFLQAGPHPALSGSINECLRHNDARGVSLASLVRGGDESETMLEGIAALFRQGRDIDWEWLYATRGRVVPLPRYPWQHERYWHEAPIRHWDRTTDLVNPLLGRPLPMALPTWTSRLDLARHAFVRHHCVDGRALLPATAYLEIALAAGDAMAPGHTLVEDMQFVAPCTLPEEGFVPIQTTVSPDDGTLRIHSHDNDFRFLLHAQGRVRTGLQLEAPRVERIAIQERLPEVLSADQVYQNLSRRGLDYSESFRSVQWIWRREGEALAELSLPDVEEGYRWHPAHLDACLHAAFLALPAGRQLLLPVGLERFCVFDEAREGSVFAHIELTRVSETGADCDINVFDADGVVLVSLGGLRLAAVESTAGATRSGILYESHWRLEHHPTRQRERCNQSALPDPKEVVSRIEAAVASDPVESPVALELYDRYMEESQRMAAEIVADALGKMGWNPQPGDRFTTQELRSQLGVAPAHERLFENYLRMFQEDGYLAGDADGWSVLCAPPTQDGEELIAAMTRSMPVHEPWIEVLARCVPHLPEVLSDQLKATDVLFPEGSVDQVSNFYTHSPVFSTINRQLEHVSEALVRNFPAGHRLRVLEIGAGTGAATAKILPGLPPELTQYTYTDLSSHFFQDARRRFADYPFIRYETLDLEQDPIGQGFDEHGYDIVIIYQCVHATDDIRQNMQHVARLLASNGILVMVEVERPLPRVASLTFGLTWGWWRFTDHDLRKTSPLLTEPEWLQVFGETGLVDTAVLKSRMATAGNLLLVARAPAVETRSEVVCEAADGVFLVLSDRGGVGERLATQIEEQGRECVLVYSGEDYVRESDTRFEVRADRLEDLWAVVEGVGELAGVVHLWNLDVAAEPGNLDQLTGEVEMGSYSLVRLAQALEHSGRSPRLWVGTRGAWSVSDEQTVSPAGAPAWGVVRVIGSEHPTLHPTAIDLDPAGVDQDEALFNEIWNGPAGEEVALRGSSRFLRRIRRLPRRALSAADLKGKPQDVSYRLETRAPGDLDQLALVSATAPAPGPGEVTVAVSASGLNFADVLKAMNLYPKADDVDVLGLELAGSVVQVGAGVDRFAVGDRVMGLGRHGFASQVTTHCDLLVAIPDAMRFQEAATIPVAFLTAQYALVDKARLLADESVLIHSASGGVGLAAIQIARRIGSSIYATAGNPEKRKFLNSLGVSKVMDSRSLDFAKEIADETGDRGVDVVLNSLAAEGADAGLSILAPYGRFVEIGKRDLYANRRIGLRPLVDNRSLVTVDLYHALLNRTGLIRTLFEQVMDGFREGVYTPLPHRVFPITEASETFRLMSRTRHTGKLVFDHDLDEVVVRAPFEQRLAPEATYLISGGLGGFSLAAAQWMVEQGARHLVLMSRSDPGPEAALAIERLRERGAHVKVAAADVTDAEQVKDVLEQVDRTLPPLRGVVHAAMSLSDRALAQMDPESWETALHPKLKGAWVLHEQTRDRSLDVFLMFSSAMGLAGNPGQVNYAAGCAFLESLAEHRRGLGLPGQTVAWGVIDQVGYVARHEAFESLMRRGLLPLDPEDALEPLSEFLCSPLANLTVGRFDWGLFRDGWTPRETLPGRFQWLAAEHAEARQEVPILQLLQTSSDPHGLVVGSLAVRTAKVLGCEVERLELSVPIKELGLDSLTSFELRNWMHESFGVMLSPVDLHGPSVEDLADRVLELLEAETPACAAGEPVEQTSIAPAEAPPAA